MKRKGFRKLIFYYFSSIYVWKYNKGKVSEKVYLRQKIFVKKFPSNPYLYLKFYTQKNIYNTNLLLFALPSQTNYSKLKVIKVK